MICSGYIVSLPFEVVGVIATINIHHCFCNVQAQICLTKLLYVSQQVQS